MSRSKRKSWLGRVYLGRDETGQQQFHYVGRFDTKRERDDAIARARIERPWEAQPEAPEQMTCDALAARYLRRYEDLIDRGERKRSSFDTVERELRKFRERYGDQPVASVTPTVAEDWALTVPRASLPRIRAVFHYGARLEVTYNGRSNPFEEIQGTRSKGRSADDPPTLKELDQLLDACDALGDYAQQMRDLIEFAALTLMRPGELYELRYPDVDVALNRINCHRRVFRGQVDVPKSGKKTIALVPPARDILLRQPTRIRDDGLVFVTKTGKRLSTPTMSGYWAQVKARAGLDFDFYLATKHYGVHKLYRLGLSKRAIAAQAGWSERDVDRMLSVYGHADLVALAEIDALYAGLSDTPVIREGSDRP
jgi:integrase